MCRIVCLSICKSAQRNSATIDNDGRRRLEESYENTFKICLLKNLYLIRFRCLEQHDIKIYSTSGQGWGETFHFQLYYKSLKFYV